MSKRNYLNILSILIVSVLFCSNMFALSEQDTKKLKELYEKSLKFQSAYSATLDSKYVQNYKNWAKNFAETQKTILNQYDSSQEKLKQDFKSSMSNSDSYTFTEFINMDINEKAKKVSGWFVNKGDENYAKWKNFQPKDLKKYELKLKYAERTYDNFSYAKEIFPDGNFTEKIKQAKDAQNSSYKEWKNKVKEIKWPGNNPDFKGKDSTKKLSQAALDFLVKLKKNGKTWSKPEYDDEHTPVAACVVGDKWSVHKTAPLTKEPTQYSLKMYVAFKGKKNPEVLYGYYMYFYTEEKAGIKAELPFYHCNSAQYACAKILADNVPVNSTNKVSCSSFTLFGFIFRILIALSLLISSFFIDSSLIKEKLPKLNAFIEALQPKKCILSLSFIFIGCLSFLRNLLFYFAPFADIISQAVLIIAGFVIYLSLQDNQRNQKIDDFFKQKKVMNKLTDISAKLNPHQKIISQSALILGILHLIFGGFTLI